MASDVFCQESGPNYVSQTYQSSEVFSPGQTFQSTIAFHCMSQLTPMVQLKGKRSNRRKHVIPNRPDNHQPTLCPSSANAIHSCKQSRKEGSLIYSDLRLNDELIPSIKLCDGYAGIMREDNLFPKNSLHISRLELFPKGRSEYQGDSLPHEIRQSAPLSEATFQALKNGANNRYNRTRYQYDFPQSKEKFLGEEIFSQHKALVTMPTQSEPSKERALQGRWPCWPASDSKVMNKKTGKIVEKPGKLTNDDVDEQRLGKLNPEKLKEAWPARIPNPNQFQELDTATVDVRINPADHSIGDKLEKYSENVTNRWKNIFNPTKNPGLAEKPEKKTFEKNAGLKQINEFKPVDYSNKVGEPVSEKEIVKPEQPRLWNLGFTRREKKFASVLNTADRIEEKRRKAFEKMKTKRIEAGINIVIKEKEKEKFMIALNPANSFFSPGIKVGPTNLWHSVGTEKESYGKLFHCPYKSIAAKHYRLSHPDPVPDLNDWRPRFRKEMFRGYHSSVFR